MTPSPSVTCPSAASTTSVPRRTQSTVVERIRGRVSDESISRRFAESLGLLVGFCLRVLAEGEVIKGRDAACLRVIAEYLDYSSAERTQQVGRPSQPDRCERRPTARNQSPKGTT